MKTFLSLLLVVFTFLGIFDAAYISYEKLSGNIPPCNMYFKCDVVLNSSWSSVGPIPLATLGLLFYSLFFLTSILFFLGKDTVHVLHYQVQTKTVLAFLGAFGAMFSLYLLFVMGILLKAWCLYCLLSACTCLILFIISAVVYLLGKKEKL